jgi:hypothetical protein
VAPQARRGPTIRDLEDAVTKVAGTEAAMNREGIKEAKWLRDAFIEHRDEIRKAFAATHELITPYSGQSKKGLMEMLAIADFTSVQIVDGDHGFCALGSKPDFLNIR